MSAGCARPLGVGELADYFTDALDAAAAEAVEAHLMGCAACTARGGEVQALLAQLAAMVPPVVTASRVARLLAAGARIRETPVEAGGEVDVFFDEGLDFLVHVLRADLDDAERVDVQLLGPTGEQVLQHHEAVPFERGQGGLRIACQRHYAELDLPADLRFRVLRVAGGQATLVGDYLVRHHWSGRSV